MKITREEAIDGMNRANMVVAMGYESDRCLIERSPPPASDLSSRDEMRYLHCRSGRIDSRENRSRVNELCLLSGLPKGCQDGSKCPSAQEMSRAGRQKEFFNSLLDARLVSSAILYGRCRAYEQVADMKEPFDLSKVKGYRSSYKKDNTQA
ncbi:hypothetical protein Tco_0304862 [Tanacetum coccineum]